MISPSTGMIIATVILIVGAVSLAAIAVWLARRRGK
jgi:LPXTG-motif cell wall-anchored protein